MTINSELFQPIRFDNLPGNKASPYPTIPETRGAIYIALSVILLIYSDAISKVPILFFYTLWLPLLVTHGRRILFLTKEAFVPIVFGMYCVASIVWSAHRTDTLRASIEFSSMIVCALIMAHLVPTKALIRGLVMGVLIALIPPLLSSEAYLLFGSKNQLGYLAEIGGLVSLAYVLSNDNIKARLIFGIPSFLISILALYISHSTSSQASYVAVVFFGLSCFLVAKLPKKLRAPSLVTLIFTMVLFVCISVTLDVQSLFLHNVGKDVTLTGRTYLWHEGFHIGLQHPILGRGLGGFWVVGEPLAERYWYEFFIPGKSGFHFHSLFVQSFVDLGVIGFFFIVVFMGLNIFKSIGYLIKNGASLYAVYSLIISMMFLLRAFVEVDVMGPFGIGPFLFYSIAPMLAVQSHRLNKVDQPPPKQPLFSINS